MISYSAGYLHCLNKCVVQVGPMVFTFSTNLPSVSEGLPAKTAGNVNPSLNVNSQQDFRNAIFQERRVELAFEHHRWYDLVRSGTAMAVMNAHRQREKASNPFLPAASYNVTENKMLLPFPQREVTLDNLTQNPQ